MRRAWLVPLLLLCAACGEGARHVYRPPLEGQSPPPPPEPPKNPTAGIDPATLTPKSAVLDSPVWLRQHSPVEWTAPQGWDEVESTRPKRLVEFNLKETGPGKHPIQFVILTGVDEKAGGNQTNVDIWTSTFAQDVAPISTPMDVNGCHIVKYRIHGSFQGYLVIGDPPLDEKDWTMICGWIEAPSGSLLFKCVGPDAVIKANEGKIESLLQSIKPRKNP